MLDELMLKNAFVQYHQGLLAALPGEEELEKITLSSHLERKMERLLTRQKKFYYPMINTAFKRVACIAGAVLIVGAAVGIGVGGPRVGGVKKEPSYFTYQYYDYDNVISAYFINTQLHPDTLHAISQKKLPTFLPKGYQLVQDRSKPDLTERIYEGEGYDCFYYAQYPNGSSASGSTANAEYKRIRINDKYETLLFIGEDFTRLIYNDGEYLYMISGTLTEEEIVKVAESIE